MAKSWAESTREITNNYSPLILIKNDKKIKLIYHNKFKIFNLFIKNNSSSSIGVLQKTTLYINLNVL